MKGSWFASRNAALLSRATRDSLIGFLSEHHVGFDGDANSRGGLGAEFCAMMGRYARGMGTFLLSGNSYCTLSRQSSYAESESELLFSIW